MKQDQIELLKDLEHFNWGTMMPVMIMLGGNITSIRSRGYCCFMASNPQLFENQVEDTEGLRSRLRSLFPLKIGDILAEASIGKNNLDEIKKDWPDLENKLKSGVEEYLGGWGLSINQLAIEAIEQI